MLVDSSLFGLTLDQIEATIGVSPTLTIFSGAQPAATTDADPAGPLVAIVLPSDWMSAESAGVKNLLGAWSGLCTGDGDALTWRISKSGTCYLQGSAGSRTSSAEMRLKNSNLHTDQIVTVLSFRLSGQVSRLAVIALVDNTDGIVLIGNTTTLPPPPPPPPGTRRINVNFEKKVVGTYNGPYGDHFEPSSGVPGDQQTCWGWCSKGPLGLNRTWDDNYPLQDYPAGTTSVVLNSVDTLAVGDKFGIDQDSSTEMTITSIVPATKTITFTPGVPAVGWKRTLSLSRGGNWFDSLGVFRGTTHYVSQLVNTTDVTVDISAIDGDLFIFQNMRLTEVYIDGQPADAWLLTNTNGGIVPNPITAHNNQVMTHTIIKNPNLGTLLRLVRNNAVAITMHVDKVAGALLTEYPWTNTTYRAPDTWAHDFTTFAALQAAMGSNMGAPYAYEPEFLVDATQNDLKYLAFVIPGYSTSGVYLNNRGLSWTKAIPPAQEYYVQFSFWLGDEYSWHVNDAGVKFPGVRFTTATPSGHRTELMSWAVENEGLIGLWDYSFATDEFPADWPYPAKPWYGPSDKRRKVPRNVVFETERWYTMEMYTKLNTPGLSDGLRKIWINGHLILDVPDMNWRGSEVCNIAEYLIHIYHGGQAINSKDRPDSLHTNQGKMHFRIAKLGVSTQYIGQPPEFISTGFPAWRTGLTVNTLSQIAGTTMLPTLPFNSGPTHWSGSAATDVGFVNAAQGGHNSAQGTTYTGNKVYQLDLTVGAPAWVALNAGTLQTPSGPAPVFADMEAYCTARPNRIYYTDGIRPSSQGYFLTQHVPAGLAFDSVERVICVGLNAPRSGGGGSNNRPQTDGFQLGAVNAWDAPAPDADTTGNGGIWDDCPFTDATGALTAVAQCCSDPRTGKIYYANSQSFAIFDPSVSSSHWENSGGLTGSGKRYTFPSGHSWTHNGSCIDTFRDRWVALKWRTADIYIDPTIEYFPLAGGGLFTITVTGLTTNKINIQNGLCYDADNDRYLLLLSPPATTFDEVWSVHPTTGAATQLAVRAAATVNGSMSSFAYIPVLGGVAFITEVDEDVWFLPTRANP